MNIEEYYQDLMNEMDHSMVTGNYKSQSFLEKVIPIMEEQGVILDPSLYHVDKGRYGRLDGIDFDGEGENRNELILLVNHFEQSTEIETITNTKIEQLKNAALRFYKNSLNSDFLSKLEESSDEYAAGKEIFHARNNITKLKVVILSNNILSKRVSDVKETDDDIDLPIIVDIWDINRIFQLETSKSTSEAIELDLFKWGSGVPALLATQTDKLTSYICVAEAQLLADLYDKYGGRLLETNVRSFLQFRGKINSGIRKTINTSPDLFFSYNNGITATADEIKFDPETNKITYIKNFQIVNGGQTTASLLMTSKKDKKSDLSNIKVQLKLNVLKPDISDEIVRNISRFANSQNSIKDSDFFTNHPFHRRFEEFSRRIWAPKSIHNVRQTHWYYERARGSYLTDQAKLSNKKAQEFKSEHPKDQLISKSDLAKVHLIFNGRPHDSVKGAEIAFRGLANIIEKIWEKNSDLINEDFFEATIAKMILWQACKKIVYANKSFIGNTKATITAYTLHVIVQIINSLELDFNYQKIWQSQSVNQFFEDQFKDSSLKVNEFLIYLSEKNEKAILSYAKSQKCLDEFNDKIKTNYFRIDPAFKAQLISKTEADPIAQGIGSKDITVKTLNELFAIPVVNWLALIDHAKTRNVLPTNHLSILQLIPDIQRGYKKIVPTDRQLKKISEIILALEQEGIYLDKVK